MRYLFIVMIVVVVSTLYGACQAADSAPELGSSSSLLAYSVHQGFAYGVTSKKPVNDEYSQNFLQRQHYSVTGKARNIEELPIPHTGANNSFHIWDDTFFGTNAGISHRCSLRAMRLNNLDVDPEPADKQTDGPWNALSLSPLKSEAVQNAKSFGLGIDTSPTADARQAFTIDSDGKLNLFLAWRGRLRFWTAKLPKVANQFELRHPPIAWDNWNGGKTETPNPTPAFRIETDIRERFYAYHDKADFFFVTESGQVHVLPRKGKLPERPEIIWQDKKRPVRLLIADTATGTTWAFAPRKDAKDKDVADVFFPLTRKITPIEYNTADTAAIDRKKPLATAVAHARFLDKHKKLGKPDDDRKK